MEEMFPNSLLCVVFLLAVIPIGLGSRPYALGVPKVLEIL